MTDKQKSLEDVYNEIEQRKDSCTKDAITHPDMGMRVSASARAETYNFVMWLLKPLLRKESS